MPTTEDQLKPLVAAMLNRCKNPESLAHAHTVLVNRCDDAGTLIEVMECLIGGGVDTNGGAQRITTTRRGTIRPQVRSKRERTTARLPKELIDKIGELALKGWTKTRIAEKLGVAESTAYRYSARAIKEAHLKM